MSQGRQHDNHDRGVGSVHAGLARLFRFCETPEVLLSLTRWVRLRLRAAMWRQWKTHPAAVVKPDELGCETGWQQYCWQWTRPLVSRQGQGPFCRAFQCLFQIARSTFAGRRVTE